MPEKLEDKLLWLFILLPGFLSITIMSQIVDLGEGNEFQLTFNSLVLTLINAVIALCFCWIVRCAVVKLKGRELTDRSAKRLFCVVILFVAVLMGVGLGMAAEGDTFLRVLRVLPLTKTMNKRSTHPPLVFLLAQNTAGQLRSEGDARPQQAKVTDAWARVITKRGKIYEGWPEFYRSGTTEAELYLSPACEVPDESGKGELKTVTGPGILIYEREVESVVLVDRKYSPCFFEWYPANKPSSAKPEQVTGKSIDQAAAAKK